MAALWALSCERKKNGLEFRPCCFVPAQGLLLAPGRCLGHKSYCPPLDILCVSHSEHRSQRPAQQCSSCFR